MNKEMYDWLCFNTNTIPVPADVMETINWNSLRNTVKKFEKQIEAHKAKMKGVIK